MADENEISARSALLLAAVLSGKTVRAAAAELGLSERESYRLASSASFKAELRAQSDDAFRAASNRLNALIGAAAGCLLQLLATASTPPSVKRAAAETILTHAARYREQLDLAERVGEIERRLNEETRQPSRGN